MSVDLEKLRAGIRTKGDLSATVVKVSDVVVDETEALMRQAADEIEVLRGLVVEARQLMLAAGESTNVAIQLPQHGWLKTANEKVPWPHL